MSIQPAPQPPVTGDALKAMREAVGLSLRTTASRVGCSHQHLSQVESGKRALTEDLAGRFARVIADQLTRLAA